MSLARLCTGTCVIDRQVGYVRGRVGLNEYATCRVGVRATTLGSCQELLAWTPIVGRGQCGISGGSGSGAWGGLWLRRKGGDVVYIALLGGINVGGHTVKMAYLRQMFTELGFANVRSYIQTGNVFFETDQDDRQVLTHLIETQLHQTLGYPVPVLLRTILELEQIVALNPFQHLDVTPDMRLCVVFLSDPPPADLILPLRAPKNDLAIVHTTRSEAFTVWYLINGRPPSSASDKYVATALGARKATTRFFHTVVKILDAAKNG